MEVAAVDVWTSPGSALGSFSANVATLSAVPASPTLTGDKTVSTKTAPAPNARRKLSFSQNSKETEHDTYSRDRELFTINSMPYTSSYNIKYLFLKTNFNIITVTACSPISHYY